MTQDEIIEMAKQAHCKLVTEVYVGHISQLDPWTIELLKIFANLVADKAFQSGYEKGVGTAFYTAPPQPEQEPVADDFFRMIADKNPKPFPLPQRTWVGLTDVEIDYLLGSTVGENEETHISFARAIEAKLKQKNGYAEEKNT